MNAILSRGSELLAMLLNDGDGPIKYTDNSDITFASKTVWPVLIDVQAKITQPRLEQIRDVGLTITCFDPDAECIPADATRVFVESTGLYPDA
jgi:hypothetical protein